MLIEIPAEEVSNFVNLLKKELPYSLFIINFIETCHKWKQMNDQLEISLLYTERSMETGVFIGTLKSGCYGVLVVFYALNGYEKDLGEALKYVTVDWKKVVIFEGIAEKHESVVKKLQADRQLETRGVPLIVLSISIEKASSLDIKYPEEVELASLSEHHADEMYTDWVLKWYFSVDALKNDIRYNSEAACGVFCKKTGDLLARCVRSHSGVLAALQTVEKARNKGCAKLLIEYVSRRLVEEGISPCTYTADCNQIALKLFRSCGYEEVCKVRNYAVESNLSSNMPIQIPLEEIPNFTHALKKELPRSLFIINFIETCHKWKQTNDQLGISLLYTERSMETGVFIGIFESGCRGFLVVFYALDGYESNLEKALGYVSLDWKKVAIFECIAEKHKSIVEKLLLEHHLDADFCPHVVFTISKEDALKLDVKYPENVTLAPLTVRHADEMYDMWYLKKFYTIEALKNSIRYNGEAAYGVFCKETGEVLSRCVRSQSGVLATLQTVQKARNKGYAKLLIRYISKKVAENGISSCLYTDACNQVVLNLFRSCGYEQVCTVRSYERKL